MFENLPQPFDVTKDWTWEDYAPYAEDLLARQLSADTIDAWLTDQTKLSDTLYEQFGGSSIAHTQDTQDETAEKRYQAVIERLYPNILAFGNQLNQKLVQSGLSPQGYEVPLRNIRADIALFREDNLPLLSQDQMLGKEYAKIVGAQTVEWDGEEKTITQLTPLLQDNDRALRERVWRTIAERQLQDREAINALWQKVVPLRTTIAKNADLDDYREYQWQAKHRFDYSPQDSETFHAAIQAVAVPAATRIYEKRREQLGLDTLRPWDTLVDAQQRAPLRPYQTIDELNRLMVNIFNQVAPVFGDYYQTMIDRDKLDLENRKGKAPGGYCSGYPVQGVPFIFMNAVGLHDDVQTLLHEGGHSFHAFETYANLPYSDQRSVPIEFAEVASMAMELLAAPYLVESNGGFYSNAEAARARIEHLEDIILFWPYMAVVDAFQHWAYLHPETATDPAQADAKWGELWDRFRPGIDYSGLEDVKVTGWHRKLHIFQVPFYYVEYGLAQLGAVQVYANSQTDHAKAVQDYRSALALGNTATLPQLFGAAGAKFAFDADTLGQAVTLVEAEIEQLEATL